MDIAERYLKSTVSKDLKHKEWLSDVDTLTSAGWATQKGRRRLALALYRVKAAGGRVSGSMQDELYMWLVKAAKGCPDSKPGMAIVRESLGWWLDPVCKTCGGHGHPVKHGTPVLDESIDCPDCAGTGLRPLNPQSRTSRWHQWLISEIDHQISMVHDRMRKTLHPARKSG